MSSQPLRGPRRWYPDGDLIHEVVAGHARRAPDATAVIHAGERVSYRILDDAADEYAVRLQELGAVPGQVVPVLMERSARFVATLLAVLKCGATYAALDPQWPAPRVEGLLRQLEPTVFVTDDRRDWQAPIWTVPQEALDVTATSGRRPAAVVLGGGQAASVFFTSGTTGIPKGVLSPHRGVVRLFDDCTFAGLGPDSVLPQAAPLTWDALSLELWGALLSGGTSVLIDEPYLLPGTLRRLIREHGVNAAWLTSSLFTMFVDENVDCFAGLRDLLIGGERLSPVHVRRFLLAHPDIRLVNGYGPAESTVFATAHVITLADCDDPGGIPLGVPVANTSIHILDGERPSAPGMVGELCVGGDGLALGYLGDAELTSSRFVTVATGDGPRRLYRTGDLVEISAKGALSFRGRADRQVKIRGRRIEPAETEKAAMAVPGVLRSAAVPAAGSDGALDRLLLFVEGLDSLDVAGVRDSLRAALPDYLVPAEIHAVSEFPLTRNGKLDEKALISLAGNKPPMPTPVAVPLPDDADEFLRSVVEVFGDILGIADVPADMSFFRLGGSSLSAGRLCARLGKRFGTDIPVSWVLANPSATALADRLRHARPDTPARDAVYAKEAPLIGMQPGFLYTQMFDPDDVSGLCLMTWRLTGALDARALGEAFGDVVERHETLYCRFEVVGAKEMRAVVGSQPAVEFLRPELGQGTAEQRLEAVLSRPLDPLAGNLCRAALVEDGEDGFFFGIAVHHLAFDGWSEHVLAEELSTAYRARLRNTPPVFELPAPGIAEIADAYRRQAGDTDHDRQLEFWRTELTDLPDLRIPEPSNPGRSGATAAVEFTVDTPIMDAWRDFAGLAGATPFVALLDVFSEALVSVTGQDRFGIGVPVAQRSAEVLSSAVGCLMTTVCVPVDRSPDKEPAESSRLQETIRSVLLAQDVPFHEIVAALRSGPSGRHPFYQVMFAYQDNDQPILALDGCWTHFHRPDPPQSSCELLTELYPEKNGTARVRMIYEIASVPEQFVIDLADTFSRILSAGPAV